MNEFVAVVLRATDETLTAVDRACARVELAEMCKNWTPSEQHGLWWFICFGEPDNQVKLDTRAVLVAIWLDANQY